MTLRQTLLSLFFVFVPVARGQELVATPDHANGIYAPGEKIRWTLAAKPEGSIDTVQVTLKRGGYTALKTEKLELAKNNVIEATLDAPDTLLVELKHKAADKEVKKLLGAVVAPEKITPSADKPADFDAFWAEQLKKLSAIPANVKLEAADPNKDNVDYFKLTMDNINGSHIYAQLAKPKKEGKFPALLIVQWAGVYGLPKTNVTNRAAQGWLALNVMAHDLPFDQPDEFYKKASATTHKDYISMGADDRGKSYFLRMYLSCYRAADYLAHREDWDGKTLVVYGTSQGGQQAFVTAGLHPKITAMIANVPAGCDVTARQAGRAIGFPYWANTAQWKKNEKIVEVGRYFDAANFARNITCPAMVSMGLIDETCPPAGVLGALNITQGPKEAIVLPLSNHQGAGNAQAEFFKRSEAWLRELVKGNGALPKQ